MKAKRVCLIFFSFLLLIPLVSFAGFEENFEDNNFSSRGWYDNINPVLSSVEAVSGSTSSAEFRFPVGATRPINGGAMRRKFTESDSVYLSYWVKYSSNWQGSNRSYHPHEFYILTNKSSDWSGLANTHLTAYIEQNEGVPLIGMQDGLNIDQSRIGHDLTEITESRAVAGCNGDSDGLGESHCYYAGSGYMNWKQFKAKQVYFSDEPGPFYKNNWHKVEVYLKLNSIGNGKAIADGIIQYWFDGDSIIDYNKVVFRTGQHADMKFKQFIIAPWIGDGSPVDQTFWVDNLVLSTDLTKTTLPDSLAPPSNLRIIVSIRKYLTG